jgi:hypothetical protein
LQQSTSGSGIATRSPPSSILGAALTVIAPVMTKSTWSAAGQVGTFASFSSIQKLCNPHKHLTKSLIFGKP